MSSPVRVDLAAMAKVTARVRAEHAAVVAQAQAVDGMQAGPRCSGRDYAEHGTRYVSVMRTHLVQSVQDLGAEVILVADALEATYRDYAATEKANTRRIRS